jgi:hypothetical protein
MAMDGGIAGLEQSQHHPLAGRSQFNPPSLHSQTQASESLASVQGDEGDQAASLIQSIKACVIPGKEDEVSRLLRELRVIVATAATTSAATSLQTSRTSFSDDDPVTIGQLKSILQEALQKPATATLQRPSYASVARQQTTAPIGNFQLIPERRTRELRIRAENQTEDLARRSAVEVVAAANTALSISDVVATRRLPSGDTILTFQDMIPQAALQDHGWVQRVFGATAQLYETEFAVIAKGLPVDRIIHVNQSQLLLDLQKRIPDVIKLKVEPPRAPTARFTTAILHLRSADAATRLCERGLIWEAQIFNCEPYSADLRIRRCFRCHQFGHIGRYCKNKARCGHCAGAAHPQGEVDCPQIHGTKKCVNCGGPHPAWHRECPKALEAKEQAHVAYQHRPRQFEVLRTTTTSRVRSATPASSQDSDDGFQTVRSKRQRTIPPTQSTQGRASEAPARRGRPPLAAIEKVNVQSRDISQMFRQGSSDPFLTQDSEITSTQL